MYKKHVFPTAYAACEAAAEFIVNLSKKMIDENGRFTIALSGGNTPRMLYQVMATPEFAGKFDWKNIFIFWSDERYLPTTNPDNNSHMALSVLLENVPVPQENIFPVPVNFTPEKSALSYQETLQTFFHATIPVIDLILLGVGENAHTASLFPYSSLLDEKKDIVKSSYVRDVKMDRITFTPVLINNAKNIILLVTGKEKSKVVETAFKGPRDIHQYPIQLITKAEWFLDENAAEKII